MKVNHIRQNVFPVLAALIWGTAFVAQSVAADLVGPFSFTAATKGSGSKVTERSSPKVMCSAISSAVMAIFSAPAMVRARDPPRY